MHEELLDQNEAEDYQGTAAAAITRRVKQGFIEVNQARTLAAIVHDQRHLKDSLLTLDNTLKDFEIQLASRQT